MRPQQCGSSGVAAIFDTIAAYVHHSVDAFLKKEWYDIKAPSMFTVRSAGKTLITRSQGTSEFMPLAPACRTSLQPH